MKPKRITDDLDRLLDLLPLAVQQALATPNSPIRDERLL